MEGCNGALGVCEREWGPPSELQFSAFCLCAGRISAGVAGNNSPQYELGQRSDLQEGW